MLHGGYYFPSNKCDLLNDPLIACVIYKQFDTAGLAKHYSEPYDFTLLPITATYLGCNLDEKQMKKSYSVSCHKTARHVSR
jgi:hypothetical protein